MCICIIVSIDHKALVYIGGVASAVIFPLGILILIYHYCCERQQGVYVFHEVMTLLYFLWQC